MKTQATQAIDRSISHDEIVTIRPDDADGYREICAALSAECDDHTHGDDTVEFWGNRNDGDGKWSPWRVHVWAGHQDDTL